MPKEYRFAGTEVKVKHVGRGCCEKVGLPRATFAKALIQAEKEPSLQETLTKGDLIIKIIDPTQFGQFLTTEYDRWGATVKAVGIKTD